MARLTPEQFQEKHNRRLKSSIEDMKLGISRVTEAPTMKAAQKLDKARLNYNAAIDSGKMKRRLEAVSLDEWKRKMIDVGVGRVAAGIDAAKDKVVGFAQEFLPYLDSGVTKIKAMPDATLEDSIARATAMMRHNAKFQRKG